MTPSTIAGLLQQRLSLVVDEALAAQLTQYLALLLHWNERTNLTAIRDAEEIVLRHFGESLICARALPVGIATLLDYGSGAGFPGAVCALARPEIEVLLAESQGKKAAFLQELCRVLNLKVTVHAGRVAELPAARRFDAVTLRAVDRMSEACMEANGRIKTGGWLAMMTTQAELGSLAEALPGMAWRPALPLAGSRQGVVALGRVLAESTDVPRGTFQM